MSESKARPRAVAREKLRETLILPRRVLVNITRDIAEVIGKVVYEHEIDILKLIHGDGAVQQVDDPLKHQVLISDPATIAQAQKEANIAAKRKQQVAVLYCIPEHPVRFDPVDVDVPNGPGNWVDDPIYVGDEIARLRAAYGMDEEKKTDYVDLAYPHEGDLIEACGGPYKPVKAVAA